MSIRLVALTSLTALAALGAVSCSDDEPANADSSQGGASATSSSGGKGGKGGKGNSTAGSAGKSQGTAGTGAGGGTDCDGEPCNLVPDGLLNPDYTTTWNPGILEDAQLDQPLGADGLPVRTTVCESLSPGDNIQAAIDDCPEGEVVELAAGTYTVNRPVSLTKGVVLRGAGSGDGGTVIVRTGGGSVVQIGSGEDQTCYQSNFDDAVPLTEDAVKETKVITVGAAAASFEPGDLAMLDQLDDEEIQKGDCIYFKRVPERSVTERVEIAAVDADAGTVTLTHPLHWTFKAGGAYEAHISRARGDVTRWAGVENLKLQGGSNPDYLGKAAGGIEISNAAYSWVKDVQTDETVGGTHVNLTGTYRVVIRDSYFHHSADYGFGRDCYGVVLRCGAADNLIENNIIRYMNKPLMMNVSGGGNVMGYNYADNSWADPPGFQEFSIDNHCSFPHMELMEGNIAPHVGSAITHGNAGYFTFFRNHASSQFAPPPVAGFTQQQTSNIVAVSLDVGNLKMSFVGNVLGSDASTDLGTAPLSERYMCYGFEDFCIFWFGEEGDIAETTLWAHGNYDTVNGEVMWAPDNDVREIPPSLYLKQKPAWWPSDKPWPWVGPDLTPMIGSLPAHERAQAL